MGVVDAVAAVAGPWESLYGDSAVLQTGVMFLHFAGLLAAGGLALAADRASLRMGERGASERRAFVAELATLHRPVLLGLGVVVVTGVAMLLADVEALLPSPVFWIKMGGFALLLVNGVTIRRAEARLSVDVDDAGGWRTLRAGARRSAVLWLATLLVGTLLSTVA